MTELSRSAPTPSHSQYQLMRERRFAPFFWTLFLGALNDNIFKVGFTSLLTFQAAQFGNVDPKNAAFIISAIFILPFVLFSATSGQIADKYDKASLTRLVKVFEIGIMLLGTAGYVLHDVTILYVCTFLMGTHSTLFGPVKYAYLPQHLREDELVGGNGIVESGTSIAILLGTIAGSEAARVGSQGTLVLSLGCVGVAVLGRVGAGFVPRSTAAQPELAINWNPLTETWRNLALARADRTLFVGLLGISWLWFVGATLLTSFFSFAKDNLFADAGVVTLLLATFSVGIGIGSLLCERLSGRRVELGLVPLGAIGMSVFAADLYLASRHAPTADHLLGFVAFLGDGAHWRVLIDLLLLSVSGGIYSVPLYALIQHRSKVTHRARMIAANNILNSLFMIVSSLMALALTALHFTIPELYLTTAVLNVVVTSGLFIAVPEFLTRFKAWIGGAADKKTGNS
ncbi:Lysophospholipid transporter LplT [Pararobbsia alpina]|uniref:Lysophospholipid transporter LplT n=1 Tax=Pararobbsia alpina TaxID=621374 RepID=A0A6S7B8Q0_9BURK|nr:Lysophospholipid transporter LplT [Pararobbsia alpina]